MKGRYRKTWFFIVMWLGILAFGVSALSGQGQAAPQPNGVTWPSITLSPFLSGLERPVHLTHAGDGSGRIFIIEQAGRVKVYQDGSLLVTPFLNITDRVLFSGEQGLLSIAFPPNYAAKGYFYVYYTSKDGNNRLSRFRLLNANQANPASEELILLLPHPNYSNHNGGQIAFGPDGYLYLAPGDGGGGGDPANNAQNPAVLLGKMLRIDPEIPIAPPLVANQWVYLPLIAGSGHAPAYRIPPSNPFVGQSGYRPEIWALGLRNPWRFSFDRANGDLYIADVGQNAWEEINYQPGNSLGGQNYGWRIMEGNHCFNSATCNQTGLTLPVWEYSHSEGCSVTGGFVYRGSAYPSLQGIYFFADFCNGKIWGLVNQGGTWQSSLLLDSDYKITSFGEDEAGELYVLGISGTIAKITTP